MQSDAVVESPPLKAFQVVEEEKVDKRERGKHPPPGAGIGEIPTPDTPPVMSPLEPVACIPGHPRVVQEMMITLRS